MSILFLKLLLAHFIGDFVLQPKSWVQKRKDHILYLLIHIAMHTMLLVLFFIPELSDQWQIILFISCVHLLIDSAKIYFEKKFPRRTFLLFIADQTLHILSLVAVVWYTYGLPVNWETLFSAKSLLYVLAFVLTVFVSPIMLRVFFSKWTSEADVVNKPKNSLVDAGMLIGIMERLLIVLFIQVGFLSGIGFLLGAKSIFRFGDLTNAKDTKFTEYILVGTLASFVIGIAIGYGLRLGLKYLV
ncbi:DUF3307 domain-containing protein [Sphingobacterium sp. DN00404]|uniref:DUF3307 domain-containing protein n=1 Tax=Sphingobacterium micropteri TaxID=2763501 RepID=A0ABR7YM95_9SPHI|nr:DUF3307 domain-containing protein [Sphingobacterium micropteri]MBD1432442.1 DUF3307 domain-containing protein [Sphingobacterium micropteri]